VVPVSPNTLYAYLQTILLGLNSMRVGQRAEMILREIAGLENELQKFAEVYGKLGTHVRNAFRSYEDSTRELGKVEARIKSLGQNSNEQLPLSAEPKSKAIGSGE